MQAHDSAIAAMAAPHLRPGETVTSTAFVERQIPALIRTLRFIRFAYLEDFQVAVTNERLLLFTRGGRLFGRKAGTVAAIEHSSLVKAETFQAFAIGSIGIRLTLANGLAYEFLVPKKLAGYEGQEAFVAGYVPWLTEGIAARGFPARGPEVPRLPVLDMPTMLAHWALAVAATGFALMNLMGVFAFFANGYLSSGLFALLVSALSGAVGVFAFDRIRSRATRLRGETPVPLLTLAKTHRTKLALAGAALTALVVVGSVVSLVSEHMAEQEEADRQAENDATMASAVAAVAEQQAAAAVQPAIDQWPPTIPPLTDPPLATAPSALAVRARFVGYGFVPRDERPQDPLVEWSFVATGQRGQTVTITVESTGPGINVSRVPGNVVALAVRGPGTELRERILAPLQGQLLPRGEALGEALRAAGIQNVTVAGAAAQGTDSSGNEFRLVARALTRTDSAVRGRYCVTGPTSSVCAQTEITEANYTLTGTTTFDDIRRDWSTWAARAAAAVVL